MREFNLDINKFIHRERKKVAIEVFSFALLSIYFYSDWSTSWSNELKLLIWGCFVLFLLFEWWSYPRAKAIAQSFSVNLTENALIVTYLDQKNEVLYQDFKIAKVTKINGEIKGIRLKTVFGQSINLEGIKDMNTLYENLVTHVGAAHEIKTS